MNKNYLYGLLIVIIIVSIIASVLVKVYLPGEITGKATGTVSVFVQGGLGIGIVTPYNLVNFGDVYRSRTYDTDPNTATTTPATPILVRNEGDIDADITVCAGSSTDNLFWESSLASGSSQYFKYKVDVTSSQLVGVDNCGTLAANNCFTTTNSRTAYVNAPFFRIAPGNCDPTDVNLNAINNLRFGDTNDEAEIDIFIEVPTNEPNGAKSVIVTITGVDPGTIP